MRRAPAPFAGDDLISFVTDGAHDDRLNDPVLTDRACKVLELGLIELPAGVARVTGNELDRDPPIGADGGGGSSAGVQRLIHFADQSGKAATQTPLGAVVVHLTPN